jgi:hypothetical protein
MEQFIQIMIADADLRLLPVKAIARWPPDIRSTFASWIIHLSSVGAGLAFQVDPRITICHQSESYRCKGGRPQPQLSSFVRVRTRAPTQTHKTLWQMARRLCRPIACIFGDFIRHRCWHFFGETYPPNHRLSPAVEEPDHRSRRQRATENKELASCLASSRLLSLTF